jgi:hypothetical protein
MANLNALNFFKLLKNYLGGFNRDSLPGANIKYKLFHVNYEAQLSRNKKLRITA